MSDRYLFCIFITIIDLISRYEFFVHKYYIVSKPEKRK